MKFNLICGREWIPSFIIALGQTANAIGTVRNIPDGFSDGFPDGFLDGFSDRFLTVAIGAFFSGPFCDRYGRRKGMIFGFGGILLFGFILPLMPNWWSFAIVWFGLNGPKMFINTACSVYVIEILGQMSHYESL